MKMSIYRKVTKILNTKVLSCYVYYQKSNTVEKNHYHDGVELLYIVKGSCKSHKKGEFYLYKSGQAHQIINDSDKEIVFLLLQIPPESEENTHYL